MTSTKFTVLFILGFSIVSVSSYDLKELYEIMTQKQAEVKSKQLADFITKSVPYGIPIPNPKIAESSDTTCVPAFDSYARDVALTIDKIPSTIDASLVNDKLHITASLSQLKMELMDRGAILSHFFFSSAEFLLFFENH
ncbi:hypothetical protein WR25_03083 [Diploscapter pachys]|uniref:Uncharacterized protein n=1 Tax=Diploscapter pachys TaxID=2018661 RepID=A0A2A2L621_9BILA|nr:hypothetical protein WR25_03083 [Diploscapter pachys]